MSKQIALVTGVGRQVGMAAAIARKLAANNGDLVLTYWTRYEERMPWGVQPSDPLLLKEELECIGASVLLLESDLEQPGSAPEIFRAVTQERGSVSALVLCHCESVASGILNTTLASFDRHFAVNTRARWQLIKELAGQIPCEGGGIVALTRDHTVQNLPYDASKGALDRIVIADAGELAHLRITSNVIHPGPIDTGWMDEATRQRLIKRQPTGRLGLPEDTANLVLFLLSATGSWINGQLIQSDGGLSA